jgi:4-hydroxybenzoate polyprenyltransferase
MILTLAPVSILFSYPAIEYMKYYFYLTAVILFFIGFYTWKATKTNQYRLLHNILKILLLIGVFSLLFIDKSLILDKVVTALD